jgi:hypothetical protein
MTKKKATSNTAASIKAKEPSKQAELPYWQRPEVKAKAKRWREENKAKVAEWGKKWRDKKKNEIEQLRMEIARLKKQLEQQKSQ